MTAEQAIQAYCQRRDPDAFGVLVRTYGKLVYAAALRHVANHADAEDVAQQTFLKLARSACAVRNDLGAWLHAVAVNGARDLARRESARRKHEARAASEARPTISGGDDDDDDARAVIVNVDDAIRRLPQAERSLVAEHYFAGRSQRELAEVLGVSQPTVQRRLAAAVDRLRADLARHGVHANPASLATAMVVPHAAGLPRGLLTSLTKIGLSGSSGPPRRPPRARLLKACLSTAAALVTVAATLTFVMRNPRPASPARAATTGPAHPPTTRQAFDALGTLYALAPGEDLRKIASPFPPERGAWVELQFPHAGGAGRIRSLQFTSDGRTLHWKVMAYGDASAAQLARAAMDLRWFDVDGLSRLGWKPGSCDLVLRAGLTTERKLAALASVVLADTGQAVRFAPVTERRPCIVLRGRTRPPPQDAELRFALAVTLDPLTPEESRRMVGGQLPRPDAALDDDFPSAAQKLDAPFFSEGDGPLCTVAYTDRATRLERRQPDYREKLARVLSNLRGQVGGDWSIEERDVTTWRPAVPPTR